LSERAKATKRKRNIAKGQCVPNKTFIIQTVKLNVHSYHNGLLDQGVAVLTHVLQDLVGCIVAGSGGGLGGHSKWINQSL